MTDPLHARVDKLMKKQGLDALLLTGTTQLHPSFYYLVKGAKLEGATLVWKRGGKKLLFCADMERDNAASTGLDYLTFSQTPLVKLIQRHAGEPAEFQLAWLSWCLKKAAVKGKVAIYGPVYLEKSAGWLPGLKRRLKERDIRLTVEKSPVLERAREIKTEDEIERIREAGQGTFAAFAALRRAIGRCHARGRTLYTSKGEALLIGDLKRAVRMALTRHGLVEAVPSIVAQGEEAGVPHNAGTDSRKVFVGQPLIADIFPRGAKGYFFDMTRSFCPGKASPKLRRVYEDIRETTLLSFESYEPGLTAPELQERSQRYLEAKGYETMRSHPKSQVGFCHGLGHGLGLEVHEQPLFRVSAPRVLEPGMVVTIEPGVYYPERKIGVRIEDVAVVRDGHLENLTTYPMEFEIPLRGRDPRQG